MEQKIKLATQIIIGKLKNQLNLIKYYHKYHKDILGGKLSEKYVEVVLKIDKLIEKAKNYSQRNEKYTAELMAIESQAAIAYWSYIRVLTADDGIDFIRREHQGATDLLNSLLNYGYAIFECMFTDRQFQKIQINLERWINRRYDTVVYYPMCINCYTRIIYQPIRKKIIKTVEIV